MSIFSSRPLLRWVVPATAAVAVIGGGAAVNAVTAAADPTLPQRTAAQLMVDLEAARLTGFSGTVTQRAELGLPKLPTEGSTDLWSLVTGAHTLRVWYSGPENVRIALLGTLGETDVIKYERDIWIWESRKNLASHSQLPAEGDPKAVPRALPSAPPSSPQDVANLALNAIDPSTAVRTAGTTRVAGRAAYELVLEPRDKACLIGQLRFAIDGQRHVPLRAQVFATGSRQAAVDVAFTQVSFARPDAGQFRFNPPPGAKIVDSADQPQQGRPDQKGEPKPPTVIIGSGWTSIAVSRLSADDLGELVQAKDAITHQSSEASTGAGQVNPVTGLLADLPKVQGPWGSGTMLSAKLFPVLLIDDGRVLLGAVTPDRLTRAAADPAAALKGGA